MWQREKFRTGHKTPAQCNSASRILYGMLSIQDWCRINAHASFFCQYQPFPFFPDFLTLRCRMAWVLFVLLTHVTELPHEGWNQQHVICCQVSPRWALLSFHATKVGLKWDSCYWRTTQIRCTVSTRLIVRPISWVPTLVPGGGGGEGVCAETSFCVNRKWYRRPTLAHAHFRNIGLYHFPSNPISLRISRREFFKLSF